MWLRYFCQNKISLLQTFNINKKFLSLRVINLFKIGKKIRVSQLDNSDADSDEARKF